MCRVKNENHIDKIVLQQEYCSVNNEFVGKTESEQYTADERIN